MVSGTMKTMHLFAGGGGGMYADLILGHTPTVAVEWEKAACDVLRARKEDGWWPDCEIIEGDIRAFSGVRYAGKVDCIHAGFPCPTFSHAGKGAGLDDDRGTLYREAIRVFNEVRPDYLFLENVPGILTAQSGYAFARIMADLAEIGFDSIRWGCLSAAEVGANHRRNRWWCLAQKYGSEGNSPHTDADSARSHRAGVNELGGAELQDEQECELGPVGEILAHPNNRYMPEGETLRTRGNSVEYSGEDLADAGIEGSKERFPGAPCSGRGESKRSFDGCARECREKSRSEVEGRGIEPPMGGMVDGMAGWWNLEPPIERLTTQALYRADRLKMLGNGQVPLQAAYAWVMLGGPHNVY